MLKSLAELAGGHFHETSAEFQEMLDQLVSRRCQKASLAALAADVGFDQLLAQSAFGFLEPAPDIAITFTQGGSGLLDGALLFNSAQNLAHAEAESIPAVGFQPDFDSRPQLWSGLGLSSPSHAFFLL